VGYTLKVFILRLHELSINGDSLLSQYAIPQSEYASIHGVPQDSKFGLNMRDMEEGLSHAKQKLFGLQHFYTE
jgi:hypothetical protein